MKKSSYLVAMLIDPEVKKHGRFSKIVTTKTLQQAHEVVNLYKKFHMVICKGKSGDLLTTKTVVEEYKNGKRVR